jgi:AraC-like DNA-binding protein
VDAVTALLNDVRAEGAVFGRTLLVPPWSLRFEDPAALTVVVMLRGIGTIELDGGRHPLAEGDIAVLTGGHPWRLTDGSTHPGPARYVVHPGGACTTSIGEPLPEDFALSTRTCGDARDAPTAVLTGSYRVTSRVAQRVLAALPPIVVVSDEGDLCPVMDLTMAEVERDLPGQQAVLDRLLDLLLISSLRTWFARQEAATPGWYAALTDPLLAPVLRLIHEDPAEQWTVASLADRAGVSRSTLARRFADVVGETPMAYLTGLRLSIAGDLLRTTDLTVEALARRVGYHSGFGLSVAFKRVLGERPSEARIPA